VIELLEPIGYFIRALFSWRFSLVIVLTVSTVWWVFDNIPQANLQMAISVPLGFLGFSLAFFWEIRAAKRESQASSGSASIPPRR
jgi:hypothetical protein